MDQDVLNLGSISGIVASSFLIMEVLKRFIGPNSKLAAIPVSVPPVIIAVILAIVANKVIKVEGGHPLLSGDLWTVIGRAFLAAASSSGLYTWIKNPSQNVGNAQPLGSDPSINKTDKPTF